MGRCLAGIGRTTLAAMGVALFALFVPACASGGSHHEVQVRLGEFFFKPDVAQVKVGQKVRLEFVNEGKVEHEVMIGHALEIKEDKPAHYEHDFFERVQFEFAGDKARLEQEQDHGTMLMLQPGGRAALSFTVPASKMGEWEIGCFLPGHYEAGMKGRFVVRLR